jgi:hypothetical protein
VEARGLSFASRRFPLRGLAWIAGGVLLLAVTRLLPAEGPGLAVRLAIAAALILLLPGALVVARLGVPAAVGTAVAAAFAWSVIILFVALAVTFLMDGSLALTLALVAAVALLVALVPGRSTLGRPLRPDWIAAAAVGGGGALFAVAVWAAAGPLRGDALFHMARTRKLAELPALESLRTLSEFPDGGVHPGYAVPLWHGVLALVGRLAGVDVTDVVLYLSAVLTPLALILAYAAGSALFGSWGGGVATAAAQAGVIELAGEHVTSFKLLSLPVAASVLLFVPALLALVFCFVAVGDRKMLLSIGAAALALAVVHPTYAVFVALPLGGFLVVRAMVARASADFGRIGLALATLIVSSSAYLLWLLPVATDVASYTPGERRRAHELAHYADRLDFFGDGFRLDPRLLATGGIAVTVALLSIPLAVFAWRSRWAAYVLGGALPVLAVALVPALFSRLADVVSLSQALRIRHFLPLPFAMAGGAMLLAAALAWAAARASLGRRPSAEIAAAAALVLVLPIIAVRAATVERPARPDLLPAGLAEAVRTRAEPRELVVSDPVTSYRLVAYAPVTILAGPLAHVAQTPSDRPYDRLREVDRFLAAEAMERRRLLSAYGAAWLLVDRQWRGGDLSVSGLERAYDDGRFVLFRVRPSPAEQHGKGTEDPALLGRVVRWPLTPGGFAKLDTR